MDKLTTPHELEQEGAGEWLAEIELDNELENQTERSASVKKNTKLWWDSTGEVWLLEVTRYGAASTKRELEESWHSNMHDRVKTIRLLRPTKKDGVVESSTSAKKRNNEPENAPKKHSPAQTKWVNKQLKDIPVVSDIKSALEAFDMSSNHIWAQFIPAHAKMRDKAALEKLDMEKEVLETVQTAKWKS